LQSQVFLGPLSSASDQPSQVDARIETIDVKLAKLTSELTTYQQRLSRMRDGPGKTALKQKAIKILQAIRSAERPTAAAELEHGAGGHDAGQPQEHDGDGRRDEDDAEGAEEAVW
jgi:hypothetical protein